MYTYLEQITSPADVKKLNMKELKALSGEIRQFLIENVSRTGGHLSSNLGTIELTVALHKVFTTPQDKIVWDVGHQCYTHKILTGRKGAFSGLRQLDGLSGFPSPRESVHDAFISGHGNTAISAAIGIASAKKLQGDAGKVIAIVGDGAFTGGMVYEGMNNIRTLNNLIIILNDNKMSISKNVGSVAQYLTQLRTNPHYFKIKRKIESALDATPLVGSVIKKGLQNVKSAVRQRLYHSTMFEEMGFQYVGPIDGHSVEEMCTLFAAYRDEQTGPLLAHVLTVKGKGFIPAEENPGEFHGVSAFDVNHITDPDIAPDSSFSTVFGEHLAKLAEDNPNICAITAAMKYGTGLQYFYRQHKERFFDVGMAEQHAVTFAAGLAASGMQPVVSIYSTFLQRAYDQIIHDVNLQKLNVLFAIDRAGFVPGDGETHQGIYDAAFLSELDGVEVVSPCNYAELTDWLDTLLQQNGPRAIRYPRGAEDVKLTALGCTRAPYDVYPADDTKKEKLAFVTYGGETAEVLEAAERLKEQGIQTDIYKLCRIHPLPDGLVEALLPYQKIVFAEEGIRSGGIGEHLASALQSVRYRGSYKHVAADSMHLTHATVQELRRIFKLDAQSLATEMKEDAT
ncbi:MAG: 1-deoxy-D-xylulose-5-phosphate synthase [Ruthenibacterium sp.]